MLRVLQFDPHTRRNPASQDDRRKFATFMEHLRILKTRSPYGYDTLRELAAGMVEDLNDPE